MCIRDSRKIGLFLHDPIDKMLGIPGHEERAKKMVEMLGASYPVKDEYEAADRMAAGMDRASLPGHNSHNPAESGSVDFLASPVLTHPLVASEPAHIKLPAIPNPDAVIDRMCALAEQDLGDDFGDKRRIFYYLFFLLRKRLAEENVAGLGNLWERMPADSRMPDHSIWTHNSMTAAIGSCIKESPSQRAALAVFSITPVQGFIAQSRKLRDAWTASVILSWLCFEGVRYIAEEWGPDHILYPSLHDQPLVNDWLARHGLKPADNNGLDASIASFPNKFVCLLPAEKAEEILRAVKDAIQRQWGDLAGAVRDFIGGKAGAGSEGGAYGALFDRQTRAFWQYHWGIVNLVRLSQKEHVVSLLEQTESLRHEMECVAAFDADIRRNNNFNNDPALYSTTHTLAQSALAASKYVPQTVRPDEPGEKCPMCGEREVLHEPDPAAYGHYHDYRSGVKEFWKKLYDVFREEELRENERLCAVCAIKRFAGRAVRGTDHPLGRTLESEAFESTTEIAAHHLLRRLEKAGLLAADRRKEFINALHEYDEDELPGDVRRILTEGRKRNIEQSEKDKYYAILLMDGDRMGKLVNGESLTATWGSVVHPQVRERLSTGRLSQRDIAKRLGEKRLLSPACHAAISESLGFFAHFAVAPIIEKHGGRLIYAGGDDVCALLPMEEAVPAACEIRNAYVTPFLYISADGDELERPTAAWSDLAGRRLAVFPGHSTAPGKEISISAAIIVGHHKAPLRELITEAHSLLEEAKEKAGRDALAVRLKKRSGGDRDFIVKWDTANDYLEGVTVISSFLETGRMVAERENISRKLPYNINRIQPAVHAVQTSAGKDIQWKKEKIVGLFTAEVTHSGVNDGGNDNAEAVRCAAAHLAGVCAPQAGVWNPDAAVMASFMYRKTEVVQ